MEQSMGLSFIIPYSLFPSGSLASPLPESAILVISHVANTLVD